MIHTRLSMFVAMASILALIGGTYQQATAGQFRRVDHTANLGIGAQNSFSVSPTNRNSAMEMDTFEWLTRSAGGTYRLRITQNSTNQELTVRMIGLTGAEVTSCTTVANGTCDTPAIQLGGNFLFLAVVATDGAGSPITAGSHYTIAFQRTA